MPISRPILALAALAGVSGLAGCGVASEGLSPRAVALADDFVLLGAPGYCADMTSVDLAHDPQVVLFGSCQALRGNRFVQGPDVPALVTVAVTEIGPSVPSVSSLEAFLSSTEGRAFMSRSGRAETVEVLRTRRRDGILMLHATDTSPGRPPGTLAENWRAVMAVEGRLVSISVLPFADDPLSTDLAFATLEAQCARIRQANLN